MKRAAFIASLACLLALLFTGGNMLWKRMSQPEGIVRYVEANKGRKKCALMIKRNDEIVYEANADLVLPLASTVKLLIAFEFAKQAADGRIRPRELVPLRDLRIYDIPGTDGGAQAEWERFLQKQGELTEGVVTLEEVARGMMRFSSNANAEYLMDRLGFENMNQTISDLGLQHHQQLYPFVSSLYIPGYLHKEFGLSKRQIVQKLREMDQAEYELYAVRIHEQLKQEGKQLKQRIPVWQGPAFEEAWTRRLPAASAGDYVRLLQKVNRKRELDEKLQQQWNRIAENGIEQTYKNKLRHTGQKGGYTASVLTTAAYATDLEGNETEIVFLADELDEEQSRKLRSELKEFTYQTFVNRDVRTALQR